MIRYNRSLFASCSLIRKKTEDSTYHIGKKNKKIENKIKELQKKDEENQKLKKELQKKDEELQKKDKKFQKKDEENQKLKKELQKLIDYILVSENIQEQREKEEATTVITTATGKRFHEVMYCGNSQYHFEMKKDLILC